MGLGEGGGWEPSTHCPRAWGTLCAHRGGSHTHECGSPRKVAPRLLANFASCRPQAAQGMEPGSCHGKCHGETWPLRPRLGAVGGAGKMELLRTSWFGGWCEARGGRAPAHTDTRAHSGAHTRAHRRVREPTPSRPGTPTLFPTPGDGAGRLGGDQEAVTGARAPPSRSRALRVLICRGPGSGELGGSAPGDGVRRVSRHFIPGPLAVGAARGGWGRGR